MNALILVVDDEVDIAELFRQQFRRDLKSGRFTMAFALSARQAMERIEQPDDAMLILILSDVNMPEMSGLELLPKVKAVRPDVPVIMVTAYADAQTRQKALAAGADGLITKPIDFKELREEIDRRMTA